MNERKSSLDAQVSNLLEGKSTAAEAEAFLQLPQEELDTYLDEQEWNNLAPGDIPAEWSASWLEHINRQKTARIRRMRWQYWSSAAAAVMLAASAALYLHSHRPATAVTVQNNTVKTVTISQDTVLQNQGTTALKYTLPDRSTVTLSPGSTLRYNKSMAANRTLWLEGEGLFDVVHDTRRTFQVYTDGLVTKDIGTVFKITAYKGKPVTKVRLISGKIAVQNLRDTSKVFYLTAGQGCRFDQTVQLLQMIPQEPGASMTSTARKPVTIAADNIDFYNAPLPEVLQQLGKTYNTPIAFAPGTLKGRKFTGSFRKHAKFEDVIGTILLLNNLKSSNAGDTIYVSPQ